MTHDHDLDEDTLSVIDLHAWRVPPPAPLDRPSVLVRALSPAAASPKRRRLGWLLAAMVLLNAVLATLIVIVLARSPSTHTVVTMQPAGNGSVDDRVHELLARLAREQRTLESKLAEIEELRALVLELSERVRQYEQQDARRDRAVVKPAERKPVDPNVGTCDEVYCILMNYEGACCAKFRKGPPPAPKPTADPTLPEFLDRHLIAEGINAVKPRVAACANRSTQKGVVKIRVVVGTDGRISSVSIRSSPDPVLGECVAAAVRPAVFARTQSGGSFSYPFVF